MTLQWFDSAADDYPESSAAPEALFWAAYRLDGLADVIRRWDDLRARYPETTWARRADVAPDDVRIKIAVETAE